MSRPPAGETASETAFRRVAVLLLLLALVVAPPSASAQSLRISGDATWSLSAGFSDPEGLDGTDYSLGVPEISQRLRLKLSGEVVAGLAIEADLDNLQSDNLQLLSLTFTRDDWTARFGDFRFQPENPSTASSLSLKGVAAEGPLGPATVGLTFARAQGIPAVKEFTGQSGSDTVRYLRDGPYAPTRVGGHLEASLEGAFFFDLGLPFDPDFVDAFIVWVDGEPEGGRSLADVLTANDLGDLARPKEGTPPLGVLEAGQAVLLDRGAYLTPPAGQDLLILAREPRQILRDQLQELIRLYNHINDLEGDQRLTYPYSPGTASDEAMLEEIYRYDTQVAVGSGSPDSTPQDFDLGQRRRYYDLGHRELDPESVKVTVVKAGQRLDPAAVGLDVAIHYDEGILELPGGPASILDELNAIEVSYRYRVESNIYTLGLSLAVDSERVFLNGRRLARNVDYTIDYEAGILIVLVPVGPEDTLRVEYETFRGGLGGGGDYQRNFYGGRVGFEMRPGWTLGLDLLRGADVPVPAEDAATLGTMPNTQTVAGLRSRFLNDLWDVDLQVARSHDQFPFDDNQKPHQPNQVTALAGSDPSGTTPFLAAGHQNGLSVLASDTGTEWHHYGIGQGPAGVPVHGIAVAEGWWFLATGGGLTAVDVTEGLPAALDSVANWQRYYENDGLPSNDVRAVAIDNETVWVGTADGLVSAPRDSFPGTKDDPVPWTAHDPGVGPEITAIAVDPGGAVYVAGAGGLARAPEGNAFETLRSGERFESIAVPPGGSGLPVYAGGPEGLYYLPQAGGGDLLRVPDVSGTRALAYWGSNLWIATDDGLYVVQDPEANPRQATPAGLEGTPLTSIGIGPNPDDPPTQALWIGTGRQPGGDTAFWTVTAPADPPPSPITFDEASIDPEDQYRYQDLAASEHTAEGWKGSLAVARRFDWGRLYLNALRQEADFLPLGSTERQDLFAWEAGARWDASDRLSLALSHRQEDRTPMPRPAGDEAGGSTPETPYRLWTERASLTWRLGPELELAYQTTRRDDLDAPGDDSQEDRYSATVREGFLDDRLTLGAGLEQVVLRHWTDPAQSYRAQNLLGELDARFWESLTLRVRYRRPLRVKGPEERPAQLSETVSYGLAWNGGVGPVRLRASYDDERSQDQVPQARGVHTQRASTRADTSPFRAGPFALTPNLFASWRDLSGWYLLDQVRTEAGGGMDVGWSALRLGSTVSTARTDYSKTGKRDDELRYGLTARWEAWPQLTPSLEWRRTDRVASLPGVQPQSSKEGRARAILQWRPLSGLSATTSVTRTDREDRTGKSYRSGLENRVSYALSATTSLGGLVELAQGTATDLSVLPDQAPPLEQHVKVELSGDHRFSERWSAEVLAGGVWGEKDQDPFTSYYTRLSARLTF
ncbi:TonB-dependent receptor [Limnochorda pilosa]|uniref:Uncharacterized protein n=1 Tax=Limnochorda pilosa TaxID=1555112 RepID=A0A0K2SPF6_LIMPI|nr:hypothetical protein [Limnochorda pilosa]BAS28689.1 hypothetical protein LIP_2860 [Limnochorda pilosa]